MACVSGESKGAAYGIYDLKKQYQKIRYKLSNLKHLNNPTSKNLQTEIYDSGKKIFQEIIRKDTEGFIEELYTNFMNKEVSNPQELSISFMMDSKYLDLPIEFMMDRKLEPVATRVPVYKTLLTSGHIFDKREEINTANTNVLLISSNSSITKDQKVKMGIDEIELGIDLPPIGDIDKVDENDEENRNEIDGIKHIIDKVNSNDHNSNIHVDCRHTRDIDYNTFIKLVGSNNYDIIHYNGHGYFDSSDPTKNFIFFRENNNSDRRKVVAVSHNDSNGLMRGKTKLKLVYLSCCRSGDTNTKYKGFYNYTGMLDAISATGVPNVLGMRWPISIGDAKKFAHIFYNQLFRDRESVEVALLKSRKAALNYGDHTVWCSPILVKQEF